MKSVFKIQLSYETKMDLLDLLIDARPEIIGKMGNMMVMVSTANTKEWPIGRVGIMSGGKPFLVFKDQHSWVAHPNYPNDKRPVGKSFERLHIRHLEDAEKLKEQVKLDPILAYLFISNLFLNGFSLVRNLSWESYLVSEIGSMLNRKQAVSVLRQYENRDYDH